MLLGFFRAKNHWIILGVGKDFKRWSGPTPLLKEGSCKTSHSGPCLLCLPLPVHSPYSLISCTEKVWEKVSLLIQKIGFESPQGQRHHNLSGPPVPELDHPQSKNCFLVFRQDPPVFQPLVLSLGITEKEPISFLLILSLQMFIYLIQDQVWYKSPWAVSFIGSTVPAFLAASCMRGAPFP